MNTSKKILALLVVTLFIASGFVPVLAMSAGNGNAAEVNAEVDNYIRSINYNPKTQIVSNGNTAEYSIEGKDEGGKYCITTREVCQAGTENGSDVLINANKNETKIYPGAMLFADSNLADGNPYSVATADRSTGILTTNLMAKGGVGSRVVNPQAYANVVDALNGIIDTWSENDGKPKANMDMVISTVYSQQQISVELGINAKILADVGIDSKFEQTTTQQTCIIKTTQIFFSAKFEGGDGNSGYYSPSQYFGPKTTGDNIADILQGKPSVIVDTVTYGRQVIICAKTNNTSTDLAATLNVATSSVDAKLSDAQKKTLNETSFCMTVMGGTDQGEYTGKDVGKGEEAINKIIDKVMNHQVTVADYHNPAIISASMIWLKDFSPAYIFNSTQYTKTTTKESNDINIRMRVDWGCFYAARMTITYYEFDKIDEQGKFVNLHEVTYYTQQAVGQDKTVSISAKHMGPFYITAEVVLGSTVYDHMKIKIEPTDSIYLEWTSGGCRNPHYILYVDGKEIDKYPTD